MSERPAPGRGAHLRVDVLGAPVVTHAGRAVSVDTRKAVALLAVLADALSDGRPAVPRASLAALLWPTTGDDRARATLRRTLSVLVAATGDAVVADRTTVALRADRTDSDVVTFRALARSTDREDLARAVGLVRGELLAGFALRDSTEFDDWVARTSDRLRRELGEVLERLVLARLRHGELHAGLADAGRWLELDPLHEAAHRSVMRLLAWTGRRQDALDQYERCVRVLDAELGVAPVRATTEVFEAVRDGTLPPPRRPGAARPGAGPPGAARPTAGAAAAPGVIAASEPGGPAGGLTDDRAADDGSGPDVPLVGRDDALARLTAALGHSGVVAVTGESGIGRSRLVEEFAAVAGPAAVVVRAHEGEAGLAFAPVTDLLRAAVGLGAEVPPAVAVEVSRLLPELLPAGAAPAPPLSTLGARDRFYDAVIRLLAGCGAAAIVVDDVQAAAPASAELLAYLVHRCDRLPGPLVLTWPEPGLPPRHPVNVAYSNGRDADRRTPVPLERFTRSEVARLVAGRGLDADAVWRDTAGLPLLVATALQSGGVGLPATVRDLLASRLAAVTDEAVPVVSALAVLDGVATVDELRAVSGRTDEEVVDAVEEALRVGLVREEATAVAFRHDALRRVAYDATSQARRRLLHRRAAEALANAPGSESRAAVVAAHFHRGGDDARAAEWAWTAARRAMELYAPAEALPQLEFLAGLGRDDPELWLATGDVRVALARYEAADEAFARALAGGLHPAGRAEVERRRADVAVRRGEWDLAAQRLAAARELAGADLALRARLLADRAVVAVRAGQTSTARSYAAEALAAAPAPDAYLFDVSGIVALADGSAGVAIDQFGRALAAGPDPVLHAAVVNNLARALADVGRTDDAVRTARDALGLGERLGDRHRLAALHANLADRLHERGAPTDATAAADHLTASVTLFAEVGADPLDRPDVWTLTAW